MRDGNKRHGRRARHCVRHALPLLIALLCAWPGLALAQQSEWQTYLGDSFAEAKTAFPTGQFGEAFYTIENGEYVIDGSRATQDSLSALTDNLYYYYAEATCRVKASTAGELAFSGLVFHYTKTLQQQRAYYVFYVYGDGYYGAKRVIGDDVVIVIPLARSTEINTSGPNTLAVDAQGTRFDLYINGKYVNGFTDVRIDGGGFGFYVGKQTVGAFDDFKVKVERRGGGNAGADFPASSGASGRSNDSGKSLDRYPRLDIPKNPDRPTYPWEVGVDKSERARKARRESGEEPVAEPRDEPEDGGGSRDGTADEPVSGPAGDPAPGRGGSGHPASDTARWEAPEPQEDETPSLPAGEEVVIPPRAPQPLPDEGSDAAASDVALLPPAGAPATAGSGDSGFAGNGGTPEYTVHESQSRDELDPEPVDTGWDEPRASGTPSATSPPVTAPPSAAQIPEVPREPTREEKDAQFRLEKEARAREKEAEKEARREADRLQRERREQEKRDREAQETADREAREAQERVDREAERQRERDAEEQRTAASNSSGAGSGTLSTPEAGSRQQIAASMRRGWDDNAPEPVRIPQERETPAAAPERAPAAQASRDAEPAQPIGQGVQLPSLDSAQPEGSAPAREAEPQAQPEAQDRTQLERFPTREVQPGEPTAEEIAMQERMFQFGEDGGDTVLLTPDSSPAGGRNEEWVEAHPGAGDTELSTGDSPASGNAALPPRLGELHAPQSGPAGGPTLSADPFAGKPGLLRLTDDFSKPRWPVSESNGSRYNYAEGAYEINNLAAQSMAISFQEERLHDVRLECRARYMSGASYVGYGLAARFTNTVRGISYYGFFVSQTGECLLLKVENGQEMVLADWKLSGAFDPKAANMLALECSGGQVRGYVNGVLALEARDNLLPAGGYALLAGPGVNVRFDDLALSGVPPAG